MKKQILLLAGSALILASCGSNNQPAQTQAQIDSAVNAGVAQHDAANAAKNDSTLKAVEKEKAEAIARERHEEKKHEEKAANNNTPPPPAPTPAPPPPPPPAGGLKGHSDQAQTSPNTSAKPTGGGLKAHADQSH